MRLLATRVSEGQDVKAAILEFASASKLTSGVILGAVGSLSKVRVRMAGAEPNAQDIREYTGRFEIVSLIGTIAADGNVHLHVSFSDSEGKVLGGHLKEGCIVHTTLELMIGDEPALAFKRELDAQTGFDELQIEDNTHGDR